jgi:mannose-1-phosphate guanylyltransferase/phosphomannomutase
MVAREFDVQVVRTRNSHGGMMDAARDKDVGFIGGTRGGFIFPDFLFACDGMFAVAKILELLALTGEKLGELDRSIPRLHFLSKEVHCSWDAKGRVMRNIMKASEKENRQLVDGIRILFDDADWVLLLPDKERAVFHIYAEAKEKSTAVRLQDEYEKKVIRWRDGGN